jgi:hypothetical protein
MFSRKPRFPRTWSPSPQVGLGPRWGETFGAGPWLATAPIRAETSTGPKLSRDCFFGDGNEATPLDDWVCPGAKPQRRPGQSGQANYKKAVFSFERRPRATFFGAPPYPYPSFLPRGNGKRGTQGVPAPCPGKPATQRRASTPWFARLLMGWKSQPWGKFSPIGGGELIPPVYPLKSREVPCKSPAIKPETSPERSIVGNQGKSSERAADTGSEVRW